MKDWATMKDVHVLVSDDDADTLELLQHYIEKVLGWKGLYVSTVQGIIEAVNNDTDCFDAIITDINYFDQPEGGPNLTGITAATQIRKIRPNVPIIFVSAWINSIIREEARRVNASVVAKPANVEDLFEQVGQLIWDYRTKKQNEPEQMVPAKYHNGISVPEILNDIISEARASREEQSCAEKRESQN